MKIELRKLSDIKPYPNNPRQNDAAVNAVAESIRQFGFRQPIVIDAEDVIVCGHTRYKAAQKLRLTEAPVHVATDLTPEQIKAYRIAAEQTERHAYLMELDPPYCDVIVQRFENFTGKKAVCKKAVAMTEKTPTEAGVAGERTPDADFCNSRVIVGER